MYFSVFHWISSFFVPQKVFSGNITFVKGKKCLTSFLPCLVEWSLRFLDNFIIETLIQEILKNTILKHSCIAKQVCLDSGIHLVFLLLGGMLCSNSDQNAEVINLAAYESSVLLQCSNWHVPSWDTGVWNKTLALLSSLEVTRRSVSKP